MEYEMIVGIVTSSKFDDTDKAQFINDLGKAFKFNIICLLERKSFYSPMVKEHGENYFELEITYTNPVEVHEWLYYTIENTLNKLDDRIIKSPILVN